MPKSQKKILNIEVKNIVIHLVNKKAGNRSVKFKAASSVIKVSDAEKRFITDLHSAYYKRSNPMYGVFGGDNPEFKDNLDKYLAEEQDFLEFSKNGLSIFKNEIQKSAPATGGFLVFAEYVNIDDNIHYLLVLTTNNKDGFSINDKLEIEDIKSIDMSKVDVACLINLSKYSNYEDETGDTYLSFVRGKKDVSVYFLNFIDCNDKTTNKESSKRLMIAISDYMKHQDWDRDMKRKKKELIYSYCDNCMYNNESIKLLAISELMNSDEPNDFMEYASNEEHSVSAIISGDRSQLKQLKSIYYKDKNMTSSCERKLLIENRVHYDDKKKELTFRNIPEELIDQILKL